MPTPHLLDEILQMIRTLKDNPESLEKLHQYLREEFFTSQGTDDEAITVPKQYLQLVKDAADSLSAGMVCYINPATLEKMDIPRSVVDSLLWDFEEPTDSDEGDEDNLFYADLKRIRQEWENTITIEPPESSESFSFMEQFVYTLQDGRLKKMLTNALSGRKPFSHFNSIIHQSEKRNEWFAFRQQCLENYVTGILSATLWDDKPGG